MRGRNGMQECRASGFRNCACAFSIWISSHRLYHRGIQETILVTEFLHGFCNIEKFGNGDNLSNPELDLPIDRKKSKTNWSRSVSHNIEIATQLRFTLNLAGDCLLQRQ